MRAAREAHHGPAAAADVTLHAPATSEKIRMACADAFVARVVGDGDAGAGAQHFQAKASC